MASPSVLQSQQSVQSVAATGKDAGSVAAIGMWAMEPQEVLSLSPRTASVFRVTRGRIWATLSGPHSGPANAWGDVFLVPGQALHVPAGQRLVLESLAGRGEAAACFDWVPASTMSPWQQSVGEPLADLRQSLGGATRAAAHLVQGLGRLAWLGVSGRGRAPALDACQAARIR